MTDTERKTLQERFAARCAELRDVMIEQVSKEDTWDLYLAKGAGDRAIAGDHEKRHLLELLQNARDAIYRGRGKNRHSWGRVFVAVTEHGMAIANTGAPFRLHDEEVLKAVRFLQRSDKASRGFIGHKGVGLKSILLRAGAFSVRSRVNGEILRATFSRSRTADYLLEHLEKNDGSRSNGQGFYVRQQLPRLPLFTQPHVDAKDDDSLGEDTWLVEALLAETGNREMGLDSNGEPVALPAYTTVVYLPYRDERWETLLEKTRAELSSDDRVAFEQARRQSGLGSDHANGNDVWEELNNIDRRMLVLLGEIAELQFARFADGELQEVRRINIDDPLSPLNGAQISSPRRIMVREQHWPVGSESDDSLECSFVVLSAPTELGVVEAERPDEQEPREHIRILLEMPNSKHPQLRDEPLFLYYPIETERSGLPFIIHGPFRVNSSRTALVRGQQEHNRKVLDEAVNLLENQLPALLKESQEVRRWLPWIFLPVVDPEADDRFTGSKLQQEVCKKVIDLLRDSPSVLTTVGPVRPNEVLFFPERPDALLVLDDTEEPPDSKDTSIQLLMSDSHKCYKALYKAKGSPFSQAAQRIGLGQIGLQAFANALINHFKGRNGDVFVDEEQAKAFFLNICDLFGEADRKEAKEVAKIIGEHCVPLLPAFAGDAVGQSENLLLVTAEARDLTRSEKLQKANRVVFWRPTSRESRLEDMPVPPADIPVYFMAPSVIQAEGSRAEGILSTFYEEWGTTRFESRPDLFRRVADRAAELPGDTILPVLGYLAWLLHHIHSESYAGADDLEPRPYASVDLPTLRRAVHQYGSSSARSQYWDRLESLQQWAQIQVPVQGECGFARAEISVFGPAWAQVLREFVAQKQTERDKKDDDEAFLSEEMWAQAIDNLADFRKEMNRHSDDEQFPEILPPDAEQWEQVLQHLRREDSQLGPMEEFKAIFDLLLLLGVRIGPRVEWRWLDTRSRGVRYDEARRALDQSTSRYLFEADGGMDGISDKLRHVARSALTRTYCEYITMKPHHTYFSGGHSHGCRENLPKEGDGGSVLAAWIWFPDLIDEAPLTLPFDDQRSQVDAFREVIVSLWSDLSGRVLDTGWYCCRKWHKGRYWERTIPSLAAFQLSHLNLWPSRNDTHLPNIDQRRFPACAMIAWEKEDSPTANDAVRFLPLLDAYEGVWAEIAQDLRISTFSELSFYGAVTKLRWLLDESKTDTENHNERWSISQFGEVTRNTWLRAQYQLLARIVEEDPKDLWSKRTLRIGRLALRAVRNEEQLAVAVVVDEDENPHLPRTLKIAFFSQSPRYWEQEANADKWILTASSQLQTKFHRLAETLGAERISQSDPPAYEGRKVDAPDAVRALRQEVRERLPLLLGVFKAHQAEKLDEMAKTVLDALDRLQAVEPDKPGESGNSGLDNERNLVFSLSAYRKCDDNSRAVVLAEGIALLVNQTTAVGDMQNALGAPFDQVKLALHFRGIDLNDIIGSVEALARERFMTVTKRIESLVQALSQASKQDPPIIQWQIDKKQRKDWMALVESLEGLEGSVVKQALSFIQLAAPDLTLKQCQDLLGQTIDRDLKVEAKIRHLLFVLREANWPLEKRRAFIESEVFADKLSLKEQHEGIDIALEVAITIALIDQIRAEDIDGVEDLMHELNLQADRLRSEISVRAIDTSAEFIQHLKDVLKIPVLFDPPDLLLLEWEESTWHQLTQALQEAGEELLPKIQDDLQGVLKRCLAQGSLIPLQEGRDGTLNERQRRIRSLERRLEKKSLHFNLNLEDSINTSPLSGADNLYAETSPPGGSGGVSAGVTDNQALRGHVAELFVLHACWERFCRHNQEDRDQILDAIITRREEGSGEGTDHVHWSTKTAWRALRDRLEGRRDELVSGTKDDVELAQLFRDLIEVAYERGPGYDILDPFGVWGSTPEEDIPNPRRVEIKAILCDTREEANSYRVVLTTNEFHQASRDPDSYVLRLIAVPRDPENHLAQVRWICDILNPFERLNLGTRISQGVRGGTLPLKVRFGG